MTKKVGAKKEGRWFYRKLLILALLSVVVAPVQGTPSAVAGDATSIEMVELIKMFMPPQKGPDALGDWTFGAQPGSAIRWETPGIKETSPEEQKAGYPYFRTGKVILTFAGKPTHQVLEKTVVPGKWTITLSGPRGGFTKATLATHMADGGGPMLMRLKEKLSLQHYRCKPDSISSGNEVFVLQETGKKPIWINENWSCGSGGCGLTLDIVFTKKQADRFQCF